MLKNLQSLNHLVSKTECGGMNLEGDCNIISLFDNSDTLVKSNSGDATMIALIKFTEKTNIESIFIEGISKETYPSKMKCYINKIDIDFGDVNDIPCTQEFNLIKDMNRIIRVNVPRWKNVSELALYFENEEAEQLELKNIIFYGKGGNANINIGEMKKSVDEDYQPIKGNEVTKGIFSLKQGETIESFLAQNPGKSIFVDFHATWCGPCKQLGPILCKKASEIGALVLKIDVDKHKNIAASRGISSIPVVYLYKNGKQLDSMVGFNPQQLERMIELAK